jgi:hypothetical protein
LDEQSAMPHHEHKHALLNAAIEAALPLLEAHGEFYPLGVTISPDGKLNFAAGYDGDDFPSTQAVVDLLLAGFHQGAQDGKYVGTAIAMNIQFVDGDGALQHAIRVSIEHKEDDPVDCYLPYDRTESGYEYKDIIAELGEREVFQ